MQRLTRFEHHIISDIDDVINRTQADRFEALLHPRGTRTNFDPSDDVSSVERTIFRCFDADRGQQIAALGSAVTKGAVKILLRIEQRQLEPRGQFTRDAEVRLAVGPIRRDLDVEDGVAWRKRLVDGRTEIRFSGKDEQPAVIAAHADFIRRAHHAIGRLAAKLRLLDLKISRQHCARKSDENAIARVAIVRAANDGLHAARRPHIDGANRKLVGVGMLRPGEDFANDHMIEFRRAGGNHAFHLKAEKRDRPRNFIDGSIELNVIAEPVEGEFHVSEKDFEQKGTKKTKSLNSMSAGED